MLKDFNPTLRQSEMQLLLLTTLVALTGFSLSELAYQLQQANELQTSILIPILTLSIVAVAPFWLLHLILSLRGIRGEQILMPMVALLTIIGFVTIGRLNNARNVIDVVYALYDYSLAAPDQTRIAQFMQLYNAPTQAGLYDILRHELVWGQIHDSFLGVGVIALLIWRPRLIEEIGRKQWTVWFLTGIVLLLLVIIVILDTATSTTALQVGNIPIQVTELLKVTMLLFLAWVIDREGSSIQQPQHVVMGIVIPPLSLLLPSGVFAFISATLLFAIGDLGSILILMPLFGLLLYIGFDDHSFFTLTFGTTIVIIVVTYLLFHLGVSLPTHVVNRWLAFLDPWSLELVEGIPIVDGIGQQLQHGIYAITAGSMLGSGIGFGYPHIIPAVWSDFVWAAIVEENGYLITVALLAIYCIIFWRIVRVALLLQDEMRFERMLIAGVAIHLVLQLFFMTAGTTKLFVMTGVTVPFLSHGGVALIVNLAEIGLVLALSQRLEGAH